MAHPNIYFACSIRGGGDTSSYQSIVAAIKAAEATCLSEVFVNDALQLSGSPLAEDKIYARDVLWIQECDAVIAEVSNPSLGVGYELAYAENLKKPVLTLYASNGEKKLSAMISGNSYFNNQAYGSLDELAAHVTMFIKQIK